MINSKLRSVIFCLAAFLAASTAQAGFVNEVAQKRAAAEKAAADAKVAQARAEEEARVEARLEARLAEAKPTSHPSLSERGRRPLGIEMVRGRGRDVSLRHVLPVVVPSGFLVFFGATVNDNTQVSWEGDRPWLDVLDQLLTTSRLVATIDWDSRQIHVRRPAATVDGDRRVWTIRQSDGNVRMALTRWAREVNWQVAWEVPVDFPADLEATFEGSFQDAIQGVMTAFSRSEYPLQACTYGNNVVRIIQFGNRRDCE